MTIIHICDLKHLESKGQMKTVCGMSHSEAVAQQSMMSHLVCHGPDGHDVWSNGTPTCEACVLIQFAKPTVKGVKVVSPWEEGESAWKEERPVFMDSHGTIHVLGKDFKSALCSKPMERAMSSSLPDHESKCDVCELLYFSDPSASADSFK